MQDELPKTNHVPSFTVSATNQSQADLTQDTATPFTLMVAATDEGPTTSLNQPVQSQVTPPTLAAPLNPAAVPHTPTFGIPSWALSQQQNNSNNLYAAENTNQDIAPVGDIDRRTVLDTLRLRGALGVVSIGLPLPTLADHCLGGFKELIESENGCHAFNCIFAKGLREKQLTEQTVNRLAERVIHSLGEVLQHRWKHCLPERTLPHPLMLHAIRKELRADVVLGSRHFSERWNHSKASRVLDAYMATEDIREIALILEEIFSLPESIMLQVFTNHALQKAGSRLRVGAGELNTGNAVAPSSPATKVPTFKKLQELLVPQLAILSRDQKVYWNICQSWELEVAGQNPGFSFGGRGGGRGGSRRFDGGYGAYNSSGSASIPPPPPFHHSPNAQTSPQQVLVQGSGPQFACAPPQNVSSPGSLHSGTPTPGGLSVSPGSFQFVSMPPPPAATGSGQQQPQQFHVLQPSALATNGKPSGSPTTSPATLSNQQQYVLVQPQSSNHSGSNTTPQQPQTMVLVQPAQQQPTQQHTPTSQVSPPPFIGLPSPGSVGGPWAPIN